MTDQTKSLALDYAPAPKKRRKWIRRAVLTVLAVGLAIAGWRYGPAAWSQGKLLYWQRQCMRYTALADHVVYEEGSTAAVELLKLPKYTPIKFIRPTVVNRTVKPSAIVGASLEPACWTEWKKLPIRMPPTGSPGTVLFLHERISPAGNRRLVIVRYLIENQQSVSFSTTVKEGGIAIDVIVPGTLSTPPTYSAPVFFMPVILSIMPSAPPHLRIHAGQPDPNDPSRFTIRYQMEGVEHAIDGRLDDGDNVILTRHGLPAGPPQ